MFVEDHNEMAIELIRSATDIVTTWSQTNQPVGPVVGAAALFLIQKYADFSHDGAAQLMYANLDSFVSSELPKVDGSK